MGGGHYDYGVYSSAANMRRMSGTSDFAYSDSTLRSAKSTWKAHDTLEPKSIKNTINGVRESRDSSDHPESRGIVVIFDDTGSMRRTPPIFQKNLNKLMSMILMKSGVEHPQILVGAVGDVTCDAVPLQMSQFESDNNIDEHLRKLVLEGGGGDGNHESYELALYAAARLTAMDCYEKRGQKGYLFIVGDEVSYLTVKKEAVEKVFGIKEQSDISLQDIVNECMEKFNVYFIMPSGTAHWTKPEIREFWMKYLDQNFRTLDNPEALPELIASIIAMNEGSELNTITTELKVVGANSEAIEVVKRSMKGYVTTNASRSSGIIPTSKNKDTVTKL